MLIWHQTEPNESTKKKRIQNNMKNEERKKNAINDLISEDENSSCIFNGLATPIIIYLRMQFIRRHNEFLLFELRQKKVWNFRRQSQSHFHLHSHSI